MPPFSVGLPHPPAKEIALRGARHLRGGRPGFSRKNSALESCRRRPGGGSPSVRPSVPPSQRSWCGLRANFALPHHPWRPLTGLWAETRLPEARGASGCKPPPEPREGRPVPWQGAEVRSCHRPFSRSPGDADCAAAGQISSPGSVSAALRAAGGGAKRAVVALLFLLPPLPIAWLCSSQPGRWVPGESRRSLHGHIGSRVGAGGG